jgi:hypothetical protein
MTRLDGLAGVTAQPTEGQQHGDLVIAATGTEGPEGGDDGCLNAG